MTEDMHIPYTGNLIVILYSEGIHRVNGVNEMGQALEEDGKWQNGVDR